jgi:GDP-fucose transporter C1
LILTINILSKPNHCVKSLKLFLFSVVYSVADVGHSVWLLTLYNNINAIILFIPMMVVFGELPIIYNYTEMFSSAFWIPMSLAGFFGFAIGYVTGLQVKTTSPLTHNISGTAKAAAQTVMATQWNGEIKTG